MDLAKRMEKDIKIFAKSAHLNCWLLKQLAERFKVQLDAGSESLQDRFVYKLIDYVEWLSVNSNDLLVKFFSVEPAEYPQSLLDKVCWPKAYSDVRDRLEVVILQLETFRFVCNTFYKGIRRENYLKYRGHVNFSRQAVYHADKLLNLCRDHLEFVTRDTVD